MKAFAFIFVAALSFAQTFEVASIKPAETCSGGRPTVSPGLLNVPCFTLSDLIESAYGVFANGRPNPPWVIPKVEGGRSWVRSMRYDVNAKATEGASRAIMNGPMLQKLLEERFKLKVHRETRKAPVYALTVVKSGSKMKVFDEGSCVPFDYASDGTNPVSREKSCINRNLRRFGASNWTVEAHGADLNQISWLLGNYLDRPVVNRTGLKGRFDFNMDYAAEDRRSERASAPASETSAPSIFTAVQQQLGLKLEASKGPVDVLVIDYAEQPSEN